MKGSLATLRHSQVTRLAFHSCGGGIFGLPTNVLLDIRTEEFGFLTSTATLVITPKTFGNGLGILLQFCG